MIPIRADEAVVEPVSVAELRAYLRLDSDDGGTEDDLLAALITAARASLEIEGRRILVPGRYRIALDAWPANGRLALPLSPLVALVRAGLSDAKGVTTLAAGLVRLGPDPIEAPGLLIDPAVPDPAGRTILIASPMPPAPTPPTSPRPSAGCACEPASPPMAPDRSLADGDQPASSAARRPAPPLRPRTPPGAA
ncbi:MAG: hypothetical protein K0Q54_4127 [Methylobacterium brachiatum]|nr:hypothetical protein [Methylobacterium brachiatum]